jgi:hypothetical protein
MKKAELAFNTVAVAALILVVIVVVLAIFGGITNNKFVPFLNDRLECSSQPGYDGCFTADVCAQRGGTAISGLECPEGTICCLKK